MRYLRPARCWEGQLKDFVDILGIEELKCCFVRENRKVGDVNYCYVKKNVEMGGRRKNADRRSVLDLEEDQW